jgi:hypothetical protein
MEALDGVAVAQTTRFASLTASPPHGSLGSRVVPPRSHRGAHCVRASHRSPFGQWWRSYVAPPAPRPSSPPGGRFVALAIAHSMSRRPLQRDFPWWTDTVGCNDLPVFRRAVRRNPEMTYNRPYERARAGPVSGALSSSAHGATRRPRVRGARRAQAHPENRRFSEIATASSPRDFDAHRRVWSNLVSHRASVDPGSHVGDRLRDRRVGGVQ